MRSAALLSLHAAQLNRGVSLMVGSYVNVFEKDSHTRDSSPLCHVSVGPVAEPPVCGSQPHSHQVVLTNLCRRPLGAFRAVVIGFVFADEKEAARCRFITKEV